MKEKGITLIALIITIIVMLILVAVTISVSIKGNLFEYAGKATKETEEAKEREIIAAALGPWEIEKWTGKKTLAEVLADEFGNENVKATENGAEVTMPSGKVYSVSENGRIKIKKPEVDIESVIGDLVNYDCVTGVDNSLLNYTSPLSLNGKYNQICTVDTNVKWRILGTDENNQILLISSSSINNITRSGYSSTATSGFYLNGQNGYMHGVEELNKVCGLYGHGEFADTTKYTYSYDGTNISTGGRSINLEDINNFTGYSPSPVVSHVYYRNEEDDGYIYYDGTREDRRL